MSANSTPGPRCRVRCVPRRSAARCAVSRSAAAAPPGRRRCRRRPRWRSRPAVRRGERAHPGAHRIAAPARRRGGDARARRGAAVEHLHLHPGHRRELDRGHRVAVGGEFGGGLHPFVLEAAGHGGQGVHRQRRRRRCQPIEASTLARGAMNAITCQRDPITADGQRDTDTRRDRAGQRRCAPTQHHLGEAHMVDTGLGCHCPCPRARGTGSRLRSCPTTSEPCTLRTHISGRRLIRWAIAGTASALTSSGIT